MKRFRYLIIASGIFASQLSHISAMSTFKNDADAPMAEFVDRCFIDWLNDTSKRSAILTELEKRDLTKIVAQELKTDGLEVIVSNWGVHGREINNILAQLTPVGLENLCTCITNILEADRTKVATIATKYPLTLGRRIIDFFELATKVSTALEAWLYAVEEKHISQAMVLLSQTRSVSAATLTKWLWRRNTLISTFKSAGFEKPEDVRIANSSVVLDWLNNRSDNDLAIILGQLEPAVLTDFINAITALKSGKKSERDEKIKRILDIAQCAHKKSHYQIEISPSFDRLESLIYATPTSKSSGSDYSFMQNAGHLSEGASETVVEPEVTPRGILKRGCESLERTDERPQKRVRITLPTIEKNDDRKKPIDPDLDEAAKIIVAISTRALGGK